jgi:hypothetical protein
MPLIPCYLSVMTISTLLLIIYLQNSEPLSSFLPRSARKKLNHQSEVLKMMLLPLIKLIMLSIYAPRFVNKSQLLYTFPGESIKISSSDNQTLSLGLISCSEIVIMSDNVPSICDVAVLVFRLAHLLLFICIFCLSCCKRCDKSHVPKGTDVLLLNFIPSSANALLCALIIGRVKSFSLLQLNEISISFFNQQIGSLTLYYIISSRSA